MTTVDDAIRRTPVRQVMVAYVLGIVPDTPLEAALRMMVEARVRHLPVVDGSRCLGILHESDALWRLWSSTTPAAAKDVARRPAPAVEATQTAGGAARRLATTGSDALVVLHDGSIVGIVTAADLVRLLAAEH